MSRSRAHKDNRFLRGRQIAYLIDEYFQPSGSYDEIQRLSGLFGMKLENDDIENFDFRWEQSLLLTSDLPSDKGTKFLPSGRQESAFSGWQMGLVNRETLVVFYIRMPRETERHQRKERRTQEYLASSQPLITSEG